MELNDPKQLVQIIDAMLFSMDRTGRKQFYLWVKKKRREYDFSYPLGGKYDTKTVSADVVPSDAVADSPKQQDGAEPSV